METMTQIVEMAEGNPGAITCLAETMSYVNGEVIKDILLKYNIKGTDIYVLWSDICSKNLNLMYYILNNASKEDVIEAAHRQDYSGKELLSKWIKEFSN